MTMRSCNLTARSPSCIIHIVALVGMIVGSADSFCFNPAKTVFVSSPRPRSFTRASFSKRSSHQQLLHAHTSSSSSSSEQQHSSGRRWTNRRKRQTFLPSPTRNVSPQEEHALMDQLGYVPPNVCHVSAQSGDDASTQITTENSSTDSIESTIDTSSEGIGRPIAIKSYPLLVQLAKNTRNNATITIENNTPFPTLYWLTCPHVSRAISELERQGYVQNFQLRLEGDSELATKWWASHEEYSSERWNVLSKHDQEWLLEKIDGDETENRKRESMTKMIRYSGVAGTDYRGLREKEGISGNNDNFVPSVKCLHSHYAHYRSQLSRSNTGGESEVPDFNLVGKWTHELLIEQFPDTLF